jgi:hypothetical protein
MKETLDCEIIKLKNINIDFYNQLQEKNNLLPNKSIDNFLKNTHEKIINGLKSSFTKIEEKQKNYEL